MDYPLENLSPEKFQLFCQALLAREFPNLQCMPVGQPDGGRDALQYISGGAKSGFVVFQVKFVRAPQSENDPHKWIMGIVEEESPKVKRLIAVGAKQYVLLTNVPGTGHLGVGSIDSVNNLLSEELGIPSVCWWRNDICRRVDDAWNLKWVYPEIMTGPDLIRVVIESGLSEDKDRRASAIRAFLAEQFSFEREVKFKQVELQNQLLELFIDVPVSPRTSYGVYLYGVGFVAPELRPAYFASDFEEQYEIAYRQRQPEGAATFLLREATQRNRKRVVLEGAPGQGKSTITQYICQVHRMKLLGRTDDLALIHPDHQNSPVRLPIKVDLRDFALWLERKNPFSPEAEEIPISNWAKTLEAFLAALISYSSGGAKFDVSDLHAVFRLSALLLVLDGLDEVADIRRRGDVVDEIEKGVARLEPNTASLQVIVTSRPPAFANSPGLSEKKFEYFSLGSVTRELIDEYALKWLKARRVQDRDSAEIKRILKEKLEQPHIKDLARNPMQLAILLSLIQKRGRSLPDKRTALYDAYIDLFFDRESEKSEIIRDYRELLIDIHRYLGWLLHTESEVESTGIGGRKHGAISADRLAHVLSEYLIAEGRDPKLAQMLFTGVAERVMALVSRVQGTYEFEVQPLREYFAARFLFETAPYSPVGNEKRGTRPDRLDAINRNFYWLNVTRFYCGCYSKGELASLIDRLNELVKDKSFRLLSHPRILAATLLADWVFSQHPKSVTDVMKLILDDLGLRFVLTSNSRRLPNSQPLVLPKDCGKSELIDRCLSLLVGMPPADFALDVIDLLKANSSSDEMVPLWLKMAQDSNGEARIAWLRHGVQLGCLPIIPESELSGLISEYINRDETLEILCKARRFDYIEASDERFTATLEALLERRIRVGSSWRHYKLIDLIGHALDATRYAISFSLPENAPLTTVWKKQIHDFEGLRPVNDVENKFESMAKCKIVVEAMIHQIGKDANSWARTLAPWDTLVETVRGEFGDRWSTMHLANIAAGIKSTTETCTDSSLLFDSSFSLCRRARYARLRAGSPQWWTHQFEQARSNKERMLAVLLSLTWSSQPTVAQNIGEINEAISSLNESEWARLFDSLEEGVALTKTQSGDRLIEFTTSDLPSEVSLKTWALLQFRLKPLAAQSVYAERLCSYNGEDLRILRVSQIMAVKSLMARDSNWTRDVDVINRAYERGVISEPYFNYEFAQASHTRFIPVEAARKVAENASHFPAFLVAAAEKKCREEAARMIVPVGKIAIQENWFQH